MNKIALIGAGGSAQTFLKQQSIQSFDLFTSLGEGELLGKKAKSLKYLNPNDYDEIYILVYQLREIIDIFDFEHLSAKVFWFDALEKTLKPVCDSYGESLIGEEQLNDEHGLTVIYDFRSEPLTYDFVVFLADAEMERRKQNLEYINLILAPGDFDGFNKQWSVENSAEKPYRLHNLIYPACQLVPCKVNILHCPTRKMARLLWQQLPNNFPREHDFFTPSHRHRFFLIKERILKGEDHFVFNESNTRYKKHVDTWIKNNHISPPKLVTITFRETFRATLRNSKTQEWFKLADYLNDKGYEVVFVRDTSRCFEDLGYSGKHWVFDTPSLHLLIRKALYQTSFANLLTSNGVGILLSLDSNVRYLRVGMLNEEYDDCSGEGLSKLGYSRTALIGAKPWQQVSWEKDSFENLKENFEKLEKAIHEHF